MEKNEWLQYSVTLAQTSNYSLLFRCGSASAGGATFHLERDHVNLTGSLLVGNTGTNFANVSATNVILPQGTYPLRIVVDNGVLKLDTIQFSLFQLLPVSLISMNIKLNNNDTHIAWKVSEVNDCGNYEIYRSFDGINFTNISTVNCAGYNGEMNYEYFDRNITLAAGNSKPPARQPASSSRSRPWARGPFRPSTRCCC